MASPNIFNRKQLHANLERAAFGIASHDFLLRHAADELASRLAGINRNFQTAADIGAYHGVLARLLRNRLPSLGMISLAQTPGLARGCQLPRAVADEEANPLRAASLDLATSLLSLHFANDLPGALIQIRHALKPDGLFMGALLGGDTLIELRQAFLLAGAETARGSSPRVLPAADVRDMGALLQRAGFALPVADTERLTVTYADALALMRDLRGMGAQNILHARSKTLLRRDTLARVIEIYAETFPAGNGRVRATFEVVYLSGWAPAARQPKPLAFRTK